MSDLTTEEKVYLECLFSRGKVYSDAYRGFRAKYGILTELRAKKLLKGENVLCTYLHVLRQPVARHFLSFLLLHKCLFIIFFIEL